MSQSSNVEIKFLWPLLLLLESGLTIVSAGSGGSSVNSSVLLTLVDSVVSGDIKDDSVVSEEVSEIVDVVEGKIEVVLVGEIVVDVVVASDVSGRVLVDTRYSETLPEQHHRVLFSAS